MRGLSPVVATMVLCGCYVAHERDAPVADAAAPSPMCFAGESVTTIEVPETGCTRASVVGTGAPRPDSPSSAEGTPVRVIARSRELADRAQMMLRIACTDDPRAEGNVFFLRPGSPTCDTQGSFGGRCDAIRSDPTFRALGATTELELRVEGRVALDLTVCVR
ncbi:hypothetical protein [Sandaracinus amylolyticus]|uniref:hypothetical protein n=1 Tax=Sandaracinus amylolyticus TaxID=927083 RepID=UPI001F1EF4A4|nr:hypothetical protein [Sandaracinus amylolyticus]UJR78247.1 Hypothetical protein I5071_2740 [Sandaracinus amylolyticus]